MLKFVPSSVLGIEGPVFAVVAILLAFLAVLFWPFLDRRENTRKAVLIRAIATILFVILAVVLTIWGEVS